ncbi:MAG TPA: ABC transporter substrate-binding protein [Candidatus Dormibacteraeota bacterium]
MQRTGRTRFAAAVILLGLLVGCDPGSPNNGTGGVHLHVVGSWVGDQQASFMAMVKPWEQRTGNKVDYEPSRDINALLSARIRAGSAPDLAELSGPTQMAELAKNGTLLPLDKVLDLNRLNREYGQPWLRLASVHGKLVAVFLKVSIEGLIFYNPKNLASSSLGLGAPPRTWDEMMAVALKIASLAHTTPWCIGVESGSASGWPGADWIRDFYLRQAGPAKYERLGAGQEPWNSPDMKKAWQSFGAIVNSEALTYGGKNTVLSTNFATAFRPMFTNPPGCYLTHQSSFLTDEFKNEQPVPEVRAFGFPDVEPRYSGAQVVAADLFGMFKDSKEARDLLSYLTTAEAQQIWVRRGGAVSANKQVGLEAYRDPILRQAAELLIVANAPEFDLSDLQNKAQRTAFFRGVVRYISEPGQLDAILNDLEKIRTSR